MSEPRDPNPASETPPPVPGTPEAAPGTRYDIRIRNRLGPVLRSYVAPHSTCRTVGGNVVVRLELADDTDLVTLYDHMMRMNLNVTAIRRLS
jgi:hypothetical protein